MKKPQKLSNRSPAPRHLRLDSKKISFICIGAIIIFALIDASPFGGKNIQMYVKWIECAQRPLMIDYGGMFGASQQTYSSAPNFNGSGFEQGPPFFCTVEEAERAGYAKK